MYNMIKLVGGDNVIPFWLVIDYHSLITEACKIPLSDYAFTIPSPVTENVVHSAKALLEWMQQHKESAVFNNKLLLSLKECTNKARSATGKFHSDQTWIAYHFLQTSDVYVCV